jgi:hypothetical protein
MDSLILAMELMRTARALLAMPLFRRCVTAVRGRA